MGRIKSFRQLIRETCWRIIWQFSLGLLMAYLIPLASVSIQINEDGKPLKNSGVLSIFFNVSSWIYICVLLIVLISYHIGKLLKKLSYEMTLIYENSMWLEKECTESLTVKEFRETGNQIIVMQDRIRQLIVDEKQQKEDLMFQVSAASHDLKTPLTIIRGNVEFLQAITENDQSQECLADIERASQQLLDYFNQLIHYSKTYYDDETGWVEYSSSDFINELEKEVSFLIKDQMKFSFEQNVKGTENYYINPSLLIRAIQNILTNALEYADKQNPKIKIRVEQEAKELKIGIWNNGSEFPDEVLTNFGKLFYRMDKARSYEEQHYGIGLSFVCRVAKLHKGRVELRNRDAGAEVLITVNCINS